MKLTKQQISKLPPNIKKQITPIVDASKQHQRLCVWPSKDPVIILYAALVRKFGRFDANGEVTRELCLRPEENKMRYDIALPHYQTAIEVDGWQYHHQLEAYKRDRIKQTYCLTKGWILMRLMPSQIVQALPDVLNNIELILSHRAYDPTIDIQPWGKSYYQLAPT